MGKLFCGFVGGMVLSGLIYHFVIIPSAVKQDTPIVHYFCMKVGYGSFADVYEDDQEKDGYRCGVTAKFGSFETCQLWQKYESAEVDANGMPTGRIMGGYLSGFYQTRCR